MARFSGRPARPPWFVLQYYCYRATTAVSFTAPIWYLYLEATTGSYALVAAANSVWWAGLIVFEVPTGYIGDRVGRRRALMAGTALLVVATAAMAFVGSFRAVAVVLTVWALGSTFRSGTTDAWLYELLGERLSEGEFARVRGRGGTVAQAVAGATAVAGGYIAERSMADAYLAAAAAVALGLPIVWSMPAARGGGAGRGDGDEQFTILDALPVLRSQFARPPLRSFVLLVALYTGVHWGVNFFVQPAGVQLGLTRGQLGWLFAGFTVATGTVSYFSGAIERRVGVRGWFTAVPIGLALALIAVAVVPVLAIPVFVLLRGLRGATLPLAASFVNDRVEDVGRATALSAAGMVYSLVTIPFELSAGALADALGPVAGIGLFGAVLLAGSLAVLGFGSPFDGEAGGTASPSD